MGLKMNQDSNIDFYVNNQDLLISLCQSVIDKLGKQNDLSNAETNKIQLREISKAIAKLEKKGIDVPDSLRAEKTKLATSSHNMNNETQALLNLLNKLEELIIDSKIKFINGKCITEQNKGTLIGSRLNIHNVFHKKIIDYVSSLEGVEMKESKSMTTFFCYSKSRKSNIGLVWLNHPRKSGRFKVHLRKETNEIIYPKYIEKLNKYKKYGWGGYPVFVVVSQEDCDKAIELINFANENL